MRGPGGSRHQVAVYMGLIDADSGVVPTREAYLRRTGRIGATGSSFQDTCGSKQLRAMAHCSNRLTRGVKCLHQL